MKNRSILNDPIKWLVVVFIALLMSVVFLVYAKADTTTYKEPQLNLSHIECTDDGLLEVHFILLFVDTSDFEEDDDVKYWYYFSETDHTQGYYREAPFTKVSGDAVHFTDYLPGNTYIDIYQAKIRVDGEYVYLHNPHDYANNYNCSIPTPTKEVTEEPFTPTPQDEPEPTPTPTPTNTPEPTNTPTDEPVTATPTNTDEPNLPTSTPEVTPTVEIVTPTQTPDDPTALDPDKEPNPFPTIIGPAPQPQELIYLPIVTK